jgi:hypothetical protein
MTRAILSAVARLVKPKPRPPNPAQDGFEIPPTHPPVPPKPGFSHMARIGKTNGIDAAACRGNAHPGVARRSTVWTGGS